MWSCSYAALVITLVLAIKVLYIYIKNSSPRDLNIPCYVELTRAPKLTQEELASEFFRFKVKNQKCSTRIVSIHLNEILSILSDNKITSKLNNFYRQNIINLGSFL